MEDPLIEDQTSISVGQLLKEAREASGISLKAVAEHLRINITHLTKLETNHEALVCDVYTVGFLKSYGKFLNLNTTALIQAFKEQIASSPSSELVFPTPLPERGIPSFRIVFIALFLFVIVGGVVGYQSWKFYYNRAAEQKNPIPVKPVPLKQAPLPPPSQVISEPIASPPLPTLLKATEKTWVEVKDERGGIVLRRLFSPGETYEFTDSQHLILTTGNAQGLQLVSGVKILTFPGIDVKRGILLDPQKWTKSTATP